MTERLEDLTDTELGELNAGLTRERQAIRAKQREINAEVTRRHHQREAERKAAIEAGVRQPATLLGVGSPEPTRSVLGQPDES